MRPLALAATLTVTLALPLAAQTAATPPLAHDAVLKASLPVTRKTSTAAKHHTPKSSVAKPAIARPVVSKVSGSRVIVSRPAVARHAVDVAAKPAPRIAAAPPIPAPFSQNPILQLHGNARALLIFAPDTSNSALRRQMDLLANHDLELSTRDTVFVPIITGHHVPNDIFFGENIRSGTYRDQLSARRKFGIKYNEFAIILLDKDGTEQFRSTTPVPIASISTVIDGIPSGSE
jgi:hypothetical protein